MRQGQITTSKRVLDAPTSVPGPSTAPRPGKGRIDGYARDVAPDRLEPEERRGLTVPVATRSGTQEGVLPPSSREYPAGRYEVVDADEAQRRMAARSRGELPPIDEQAKPLQQYDSLGGADDPDITEGAGSDPRISKQAAGAQQPGCAHLAYLTQRISVQLGMSGGTIRLRAVDVQESDVGVTILLPFADDGVTFIPDPGSDVQLVVGSRYIPCFFPGVVAEIQELGVIVLMFVKAD